MFVADDDAAGGRRKEEDSFLSAINIGRSIPALLMLSRGQTFSRVDSGWYDNMKGVIMNENWGGHHQDGGD